MPQLYSKLITNCFINQLTHIFLLHDFSRSQLGSIANNVCRTTSVQSTFSQTQRRHVCHAIAAPQDQRGNAIRLVDSVYVVRVSWATNAIIVQLAIRVRAVRNVIAMYGERWLVGNASRFVSAK